MILVTIPQKSSIFKIAQELHKKGIVKSKFGFIFFAFRTGVYSKLKAGQYVFSKGMDVSNVVHALVNGLVVIHKVTIPEGVTVLRIKEILQENPCLSGAISSLPVEGYASPGTYYFTEGTSRQKIFRQLNERMKKFLGTLSSRWLSPNESLILASIVEKETKLSSEKQKIAGVFLYRLQHNMKLQADPTVAYAVFGGAAPRPLTRQDCKFESPYNTYVSKGLPPTPICCPGEETLKAIAAAAPDSDVYFVANSTGGHTFSKTLDEHNRAVQQFRKIQNAKQAETLLK
ncbi:MAG: endolytic transglycosylase MltG [Holosporales bacterium]|jgi:UPF0755 protein|nr:endolytic transglycosylase MltG [Holosporales bacterium]